MAEGFKGHDNLAILAAEEMTRHTPFYVTPKMVTRLEKSDDESYMYAAQFRNVCIVCYMRKSTKHADVKFIAF